MFRLMQGCAWLFFYAGCIFIISLIFMLFQGVTLDFVWLGLFILSLVITVGLYMFAAYEEDTSSSDTRRYSAPSRPPARSTSSRTYTRGEPGSATNKDQSTKGDTGPGSVGGGGGKSTRY